jgi:signal transduction histidine kinase
MALTVSAAVQDSARLEALRSLRLLDTDAEPAFDRLTRLAAKILQVPVVLVSLVDEDRQFFKSCVGLPEPWATARETPLSHSFCQHTIDTREPLVISDARLHPLVRDNLAIPDLNVVAYAGIPLITNDGFVLGSFCAIDTKPRVWTADEIAILDDLAASVMTEITLRTDIIEDHRREAVLQASYEEIQAALALRDRFLSIAAHDLNSPITALIGYADLLNKQIEQTSGVATTERRMLTMIAAQARRLSQMINSLLDFSNIQRGQMTVERKAVDLAALVQRVVERMQFTRERHTLVAIIPDTPLMIIGDDVRLEEAVQNLVQNAVKYSGAGSTVTVTVEGTTSGATIAVTDEGIGIAPDVVPKLFDEFYRASNAGGQPGIGLGLYVVKEIVSLHDGTVDVQSEVGRGSTFTIRLPRTTTASNMA